ncbi:MAG: hypothetical protein ABIH20_04465 [Candidatus Diapherotrites archaeon]
MPFNKAKTTIELLSETRDKLKKLGQLGESYDNVLNDLIKLGKKQPTELGKIQEERRKNK